VRIDPALARRARQAVLAYMRARQAERGFTIVEIRHGSSGVRRAQQWARDELEVARVYRLRAQFLHKGCPCDAHAALLERHRRWVIEAEALLDATGAL
jgi:hypothetical protein